MRLTYKSFLCVLVFFGFLLLARLEPLAASQQPPKGREQPERPSYDPLYLESTRLPGLAEPSSQVSAPDSLSFYTSSVMQFLLEVSGKYNWEVYAYDNLGVRNLTNHKANDMQPKLNRGCTSVVFASDRSGNLELFTMKADGSGLTQVTWQSATDARPDWSPDSSRIVFESYRDGQAEIYVQAANGASLTRLTQNEAFDGMPAWSPDGKQIAFVSDRTGGYRVYVMNTDGSGLTQLSTVPYSSYPVWSPDGSQIAFSADGDGNGWWELWLMQANGADQRAIFYSGRGTADVLANAWSPNQTVIAFTEVHYVEISGNWYWDDANIRGWDYQIQTPVDIYSGNMAWYLDWQSTDIIPPTSQVLLMPNPQPYSFLVEWLGTDNVTEIRQYDVQARVGEDGTWYDWIMGTRYTYGWWYEGQGGQTYYFRSRAYDYAGNVEAWPADYDLAVRVENTPPETSIRPVSRFTNQDYVHIAWYGEDPGDSGIQSFDIQVQDQALGSWGTWLESEWPTGAEYNGTLGHTYRFRSAGTDWAGNLEIPPEEGDVTVTFYEWLAAGQVTDHTGTPVQGAQVEASLTPFLSEPSAIDGSYVAAFSDNPESKSLTYHKDGYGTLPASIFTGSSDASVDFVLPPTDNLVTDWGFEEDTQASAWETGGSYPPSLDWPAAHSGEQAAALGGEAGFSTPFALEIPYSFDKTATAFGPGHSFHLAVVVYVDGHYQIYYRQRLGDMSWLSLEKFEVPGYPVNSLVMAVDSHGVVHLLWGLDSREVYYATRSMTGVWSTPVIAFSEAGVPHSLQVDQNDTLHVLLLWASPYYAQKTEAGGWGTPQAIPNADSASVAQMQVAASGAAHFVYKTTYLYYVRRATDGSWSASTQLSTDYPGYISFRLDSLNLPHVVWDEQRDVPGDPFQIVYRNKQGDGSWSSQQIVAREIESISKMELGIDAQDRLHLVWGGGIEGNPYEADIYLLQKAAGGEWSFPLNVSGSTAYSYDPSMGLTPNGDVLIAWFDDLSSQVNTYYAWVVDGTVSEKVLLSEGIDYHMPSIAYDGLGSLHVLWDAGPGLYHTGSVYALQDGESWVQQTVSLPDVMEQPALSFLYRLEGLAGLPGTGLSVELTNETTTLPVFSMQGNSAGWDHAWVDLSAWKGQEVTLTFRTRQIEGELLSSLKLDEVTIGAAHPDLWVEASGEWNAVPGETLDLVLRYANRGGAPAEESLLTLDLPAGLSFVAANPSPSQVDGDQVTWQLGWLPGGSETREIRLSLQMETIAQPGIWLSSLLEISTSTPELELLNNAWEIQTYVGGFVRLPLVAK